MRREGEVFNLTLSSSPGGEDGDTCPLLSPSGQGADRGRTSFLPAQSRCSSGNPEGGGTGDGVLLSFWWNQKRLQCSLSRVYLDVFCWSCRNMCGALLPPVAGTIITLKVHKELKQKLLLFSSLWCLHVLNTFKIQQLCFLSKQRTDGPSWTR